jgi:hypothetical protein
LHASRWAISLSTCDKVLLRKIPGDANGDYKVDIKDAALVGFYWHKTVPYVPANIDLNDDGIIDVYDVAIINLNWQKHA